MSSTTTTQYYGLTQYIGTDKPDWTDNNEAFREVDADLHEAVQSMEGFGTDIAALQEAQNALTTEVTGLEADLNTEKAKITALQNKETLQDAEIAGVKADALDMIAAVDEGTAQVATVAVNEGKYFRYNDVLYMATTNIAVGDTIVPNANCRATNVGTELEAQAEDIAEVKSDISVINKTFTISSIVGVHEFNVKQVGSVLYLQGYTGISGATPGQANIILTIDNYDGVVRRGTVILGNDKGIATDPTRTCLINANGQLLVDIESTDSSSFVYFNVVY